MKSYSAKPNLGILKYILFLIPIPFLIGCPVYCPPSEIEDSRLKLINKSPFLIQYLCSCDTIGGTNFQNIETTIASGNYLEPNDTIIIPGYKKWDVAINDCPDKMINVYLFEIGIEFKNRHLDISEIHKWENLKLDHSYSNHYQFSISDLDSANWHVTKK